MSNELVDQIRPRDLIRQNGPLNQPHLVYSATAAGVEMTRADAGGYTFLTTIPPGLTLSTGLTFQLVTVDDGRSSADLGLVVVLGLTVKKIASGTSNLDVTSGAGTEQTANVTLNGTSGVAVRTNVAVANANLNSAGAGDTIEVRVRRIGTNASDTALSPCLLTAVNIFNT
jgi:hypothetical protein